MSSTAKRIKIELNEILIPKLSDSGVNSGWCKQYDACWVSEFSWVPEFGSFKSSSNISECIISTERNWQLLKLQWISSFSYSQSFVHHHTLFSLDDWVEKEICAVLELGFLAFHLTRRHCWSWCWNEEDMADLLEKIEINWDSFGCSYSQDKPVWIKIKSEIILSDLLIWKSDRCFSRYIKYII